MHFPIVLSSLILFAKNSAAPTEPVVEKNIVQHVPFGKTAILLCHSNDANHNFLFWQLAKTGIVGPGNEFDDVKYNYEILTGKLFIRAVSTDEEGVYHCVSRGVRNDDINIQAIKMIVTKDWEEVWEHDPNVNYFRVIVALSSLLIIMVLLYIVFTMRRRHRLHSLLEATSDEEDSGEELFRAPGTSKNNSNIVLERANDRASTAEISTDFGHILSKAQKK